MNRRQFLAASAVMTSMGGLYAGAKRKRLGLSAASISIRWRHRGEPESKGWADAIDIVEYCKSLEAGSLQIGVRGWDDSFAGKMRDRCEAADLVLEAQIGLPRNEGDLGRFERDIARAKMAGIKIMRTVCIGQRRYEHFDSLDAWNAFVKESFSRLALVEPLMKKHGVILAIENHKDWRTDEFLRLLEHFSSEFIRVNYDFGNNIALLENPHEVCEALAPWIVTTHLKDMAVAPHEKGFLLAEVPIGTGVLDLKRMVAACEKYAPDCALNLEMITRDPLVVPCRKKAYRATMEHFSEANLTETLAFVTENAAVDLDMISGLSRPAQIAEEADNIEASFRSWH